MRRRKLHGPSVYTPRATGIKGTQRCVPFCCSLLLLPSGQRWWVVPKFRSYRTEVTPVGGTEVTPPFRAWEDLDHRTQGFALGYPRSPPWLRMQARGLGGPVRYL